MQGYFSKTTFCVFVFCFLGYEGWSEDGGLISNYRADDDLTTSSYNLINPEENKTEEK